MQGGRRFIKLRVHYLDNDFIKKGIWIWTRISKREFHTFKNIKDDFGNKVAECHIYIHSSSENIDFKVTKIGERLESSTLEDGGQRRIGIYSEYVKNGVLDVYVLSEDQSSKVFYSKPKIIEFWYKRRMEDYDSWKLHVYNTENFIDGSRDIKDRKTNVDINFVKSINVQNQWKQHVSTNEDLGSNFKFTYSEGNQGFAVTRVPFHIYEGEEAKMWFKLQKNNWSEFDVFINRSISLNEFKEQDNIKFYLIEKDVNKYYERPEIKHLKVNLYYKRFEDDYFGWTAMYFLDKLNNQVKNISGFKKTTNKNGFYKVSFDIDLLPINKSIDFYLRNGGEADFQEFRSIKLEEGELDVYVVQGEYEVFYDIDEANKKLNPRIITANLENSYGEDNYCVIWAETNVQIPLSIIGTNLMFEVKSLDGKSVNVKKVEYSDNSRRRFKIILENNVLKPFLRKYNLFIHTIDEKCNLLFLHPKRVDIIKLYSLEEFNKTYVFKSGNLLKEYGLIIKEESLTFRIWSPLSDNVRVNIYDEAHDSEKIQSLELEYRDGVWEREFPKNLIGKYYTYEMSTNNIVKEIIDPYAKACGINAIRTAIIDMKETNPQGFENHKRPIGKLENPIIYEMSVKDFTTGIGSDVPEERKGKYIGVIDKIDHLKRLGVNVVQILPVMKSESNEDQKYGGIYNWGYDVNGLWFLLEGRYSTDPYDPMNRVKEFKQMVMALHENGIRVVLDVVYNHTFLTETSIFNDILQSYFYRLSWNDYFVNGSGCGNEIKSEHLMVSKMIRDSIMYWVKEMCIDGFRFDLMSLIDKYTMEKIRKDVDTVNPNIMIHGEAYIMGWTSLHPALQSSKENINQKELRKIGAFADVGSRNAIRGYNFETGIVNGDPKDSTSSFRFFIGQKGEFLEHSARNNSTEQIINYIDCHDDLLFIDYLNIATRQISKSEKFKRYKLAYTCLFNYIGAIMLKSGVEGMTTKLGDHNSYKTFYVNLIDWKRMQRYDDIVEYFSKYIKFRKSHPAYMMSREEVNNKFQVLDSNNGYIKGKMFTDNANGDPFEKIAIYHNLCNMDLVVELPKEESGWALVGDYHTIGNKKIRNIDSNVISIPALTTYVLADNKSVDKMET